jgi:hypothetical protein
MQRTSARKPSIRNRGLRIGRLALEAPEDPSGDDAPMLASKGGVDGTASGSAQSNLQYMTRASWILERVR